VLGVRHEAREDLEGETERGAALRKYAADLADPTMRKSVGQILEEHHALLYRVGHENDAILRIRVPGPSGSSVEPPSRSTPALGQVEQWSRVGVLHGREGKLRFFELEPAEEEGELKLGELFVRGHFRTARKVNSAKAAREAWDQFRPE
jgi:hypothetical protein